MSDQTIRRDEAMDLLIEAAPSYWSADDLHALPRVLEGDDEPDLFVRMSAFALHVVRLTEKGDTDQVERVFAAVEQVFVAGDDEAVELMQLGLLEVLQNATSHTDVPVDAGRIRPLLGPLTGTSWDRLLDLWTAAEAQVGSAGPSESDYLKVEDDNLRLYFQTQTRALADGRLMSASQVLKHETGLLDELRDRQRRAMGRLFLIVVAVLLVLALVATLR